MKTLTGLDGLLLGLDGEPLKERERAIRIGTVIANAIAAGSTKEPARAMDVALKIYNAKDSLELEDADFELAQAAVQDGQLTNIAKAAALRVFLNGLKEGA